MSGAIGQEEMCGEAEEGDAAELFHTAPEGRARGTFAGDDADCGGTARLPSGESRLLPSFGLPVQRKECTPFYPTDREANRE
ncbi:hypothetical protein [Streptomyces sp. Isolate_219]|uniref:hypothetical protein n=1 Tax=Streptomyces sp. Isolate_219 TaxID=2950110 RepID=UPI0021C74EAF|nr:hypothetical protein [Streptomyces sp. Isolate_219]MCR8576615.1 hypothetical protein [Streptomyces sp. Isolate_219]